MTKKHAKLPRLGQYLMVQLNIGLTLKAPIATKVVCFCRLLKCLRSLAASMTNSVDPDQTAPLFTSILELVSNVRQLFAADDFSRLHFSDTFFSWRFMG